MRAELVKYIARSLDGKESYIDIALQTMEEWRCGLSDVIEDCINDAISDYILDNDLMGTDEEEQIWMWDAEELFFEALNLIER